MRLVSGQRNRSGIGTSSGHCSCKLVAMVGDNFGCACIDVSLGGALDSRAYSIKDHVTVRVRIM